MLFIGYKANKAYIAQNLCENVAKPQLKCDGKCYLRKKITQTENSKEQKQTKSFSFYLTGLYINQTSPVLEDFYSNKSSLDDLSLEQARFSYQEVPTRSHHNPLWRPPISLV